MSGKKLLLGAVVAFVVVGGFMHFRADPQQDAQPSPSPTTTQTQRRVWVSDKTNYTSPWYEGAHPKMIGFGCTSAPFYDHDPKCPGKQGFHHGIDILMDCNNKLFAGVNGTVISPRAPGKPGVAYGEWPIRIRTTDGKYDIIIGHVRKVHVKPGQRVQQAQLIALASDAGPPSDGGKTPDGCHLHFELRPAGDSYVTAVDPSALLGLKKAS